MKKSARRVKLYSRTISLLRRGNYGQQGRVKILLDGIKFLISIRQLAD